jgi:HSP90 family molecular chaperone
MDYPETARVKKIMQKYGCTIQTALRIYAEQLEDEKEIEEREARDEADDIARSDEQNWKSEKENL